MSIIETDWYVLTWKHCPFYCSIKKSVESLFCLFILDFALYQYPPSTFGSTFTFNFKSPFTLSTSSCFLSLFFCPRYSSHLFSSPKLHSEGSFTNFVPLYYFLLKIYHEHRTCRRLCLSMLFVRKCIPECFAVNYI